MTSTQGSPVLPIGQDPRWLCLTLGSSHDSHWPITRLLLLVPGPLHLPCQSPTVGRARRAHCNRPIRRRDGLHLQCAASLFPPLSTKPPSRRSSPASLFRTLRFVAPSHTGPSWVLPPFALSTLPAKSPRHPKPGHWPPTVTARHPALLPLERSTNSLPPLSSAIAPILTLLALSFSFPLAIRAGVRRERKTEDSAQQSCSFDRRYPVVGGGSLVAQNQTVRVQHLHAHCSSPYPLRREICNRLALRS